MESTTESSVSFQRRGEASDAGRFEAQKTRCQVRISVGIVSDQFDETEKLGDFGWCGVFDKNRGSWIWRGLGILFVESCNFQEPQGSCFTPHHCRANMALATSARAPMLLSIN